MRTVQSKMQELIQEDFVQSSFAPLKKICRVLVAENRQEVEGLIDIDEKDEIAALRVDL